ncbi:MAG: hypothetical protein IPI84_03140 [Holophagaceae bacterium]|nr:hypothetical protein [Holophagaceae bacterium]
MPPGRSQPYPRITARQTYCAKRTERDGLVDWKKLADNIWCAIRALGVPYPGAFTFHRGKHLVLHAAELVPHAPYIGMPGQIQQLDKNGALVLCGDGAFINITSVGLRGDAIVPPQTLLKVHDVLGLDLLALHERSLEGGPQ